MIRTFTLAFAGALLISGAAFAQSNGRGGGEGGSGAGGASDPDSHISLLVRATTAVPGGPNRRPMRGRVGGQDVHCRMPDPHRVGFSDTGVPLQVCPTN